MGSQKFSLVYVPNQQIVYHNDGHLFGNLLTPFSMVDVENSLDRGIQCKMMTTVAISKKE